MGLEKTKQLLKPDLCAQCHTGAHGHVSEDILLFQEATLSTQSEGPQWVCPLAASENPVCGCPATLVPTMPGHSGVDL